MLDRPCGRRAFPPSRSHELDRLANEANLELTDLLLDLQPFAVEARDQAGDFELPASRARILEEIELLADQLRQVIEARRNTNP